MNDIVLCTAVPLGNGLIKSQIPTGNLLMATPLLHTIDEIGEILKVSRSTVYRIINRGDLLVISFGGCKRITEASLQRFLKERIRIAKLGNS